jgi:hypothetical protein
MVTRSSWLIDSVARATAGTLRRLALTLALLTVALIAAVWLAPAERTLGNGIKWVYVHVALTWTGMTGLSAAALLGLILLATGRPSLTVWTRQVGMVGLGFFAAGWAMSAVASQVNWGGVAWGEPRNTVNLQVLAAGVIVVVAGPWLNQPRWQGLLFALLFGWMMWAFQSTPLILHPSNPIFSSDSPSFAAAFLGAYLLTTLGALVVLAYLRRPALVL